MAEKLKINTDGASKGNPGRASIGVTIKDEKGKLLKSISQSIGHATNNEAEYQAIIIALKEAKKLGASSVELLSDSELVVHQINGRYRVKKANLRPLYLEVAALAQSFEAFRIRHIPRSLNAQADRLANLAFE
jgi:ribonuclease HI